MNTQLMSDAFTPYERGLREFQRQLGERHERLLDFLNYDHQLLMNIRQAREDGDTPTLSAERNRIVRQLNTLALETVGVSFNEICGLRRSESVLTMPMVKLPPLAMSFFNLVGVAVLTFILSPTVTTLWPCVLPMAAASSSAILLVLLCHLTWRSLNPVLKASGGVIEVAWIAVPIKVLASLFDALHPWILPDSALWALAIVLPLAAVILVVSPLSPLPPPPEETLIVQGFSVEYLEGDGAMSLGPGDEIELTADELVLVRAEVLGETGPCEWSAANGSLLPAEGCSILYSAPFHETYDILDILVQSPCKTQNACASLRIKVVSNGR